MSNLLRKHRRQAGAPPKIKAIVNYLSILKSESKDALKVLLDKAEKDPALKKTIMALNSLLASMAVENGIKIDPNDQEVVFRLTLDHHPHAGRQLVAIFQHMADEADLEATIQAASHHSR